ncbi:dynein heavy chain, putative [Plasmodium ovale wallikeri]|uniref:Dynein heavy chain, putative n=1 Tax=Plasmodium ovale wallikeri TaxID=864142 RepID=A0A1A8ZIX4_PLAOA|nr:dynein heavy chain, putative [Plasmodium ovale wallikeri]SBT44514.1 dynein heavy chain, putative [Plasmodium ovale wallikeri]
MNHDFECFIKQKITSLLRIRDDVFNCYMQDGKNKDDLNYFFLSSPVNTTLFFVLYKYEYEEEADQHPSCKGKRKREREEQNKEYVDEETEGEEKKDGKAEEKGCLSNQDLSNHGTNTVTKEEGNSGYEEGQNKDSSAKMNDKVNNKTVERLLKLEENSTKSGEAKKEGMTRNDQEQDGKEAQNSNYLVENCNDEADCEEDVDSNVNSDSENTKDFQEEKNVHYVLKISIDKIIIDDTEEENNLLIDNEEKTKKKRKIKNVYKHIIYFFKINNNISHANMDEYFNNNYTFGNLHHNYINNFKAYFKIYFIPFFLCLLKKNDVFDYIGKELDQNAKVDNVLTKLQNFKKTEMFNNKLGDINELNENIYLNIIEREKHAEQQSEEENRGIFAAGEESNRTLEQNLFPGGSKTKKPGKGIVSDSGDGIISNGSCGRSSSFEKKKQTLLCSKNILNSLCHLLSYYKQILKVEHISHNEINTDIIKLKDDTININNYLRNISNLIKDFIAKEKKNDSKKKNDKTTAEYWKERYHRIYSLLEKINSKKFEQIIENIKGKKYNNELCNEIKFLLKEIENMHMESFEMIKFSKLLENSFEMLKCNNINQMKNGIKLVIRKLKNIWLSSKYFRKDEIIIAFFLRLSEILFEFILFLAIKVKKINKPKRIKKIISKCIDILKFYEKEFIYVKLDIETIDIRKNWYFDKNVIFKNIRHLQHVLATLYTVYSEIIYFTDLCLLKLKKLVNNKQIMNSIILEINKLYEPFNDVLKNIYLYDDESIMHLMRKLNEHCSAIEKKCIRIIHVQFSNLRNTKATYMLVEKFQNLKKSYKIDRLLIKKLYDILFLYKKELYLYIDSFNNMCANKDLSIYKRFLFCLNIYKKIKKPILIFKNNSYITTSNEYKIIIKLYINFCKKMFSYIVETYVIWKNNSLSQMNKLLSSNIITINKQLNFYYVINFDNNFFKTLYEYAYIESIYDFNTSIEILNMYNLKKKLYRYLYELNEIILFYKNFTTSTSIIEQKVLIKFFQCFEQKLIYISNNINWLNLNIDHYINDLKNCKSTIENVHLSLSYSLNSIDNIIFNMQNINVVRYIEWGNMKPLHIQPFFNYFEQYRISEVNKIVQKYKEISQILIKIEQIVEKTKNGRSEVMDELYYLYQCKIYKCLSLIIIKGLCTYETLIENDFPKKFLYNYKPCLYIKEDIYSDVFLNNSIQNIFKLISKLLTNLLLSSSEFIRWLDYSCIEVPISLKEDFEFFKMKFSFYQSVSKNKIIIDRIIHIHQLIQNVFQKANKYIYSFLKYDNIINSIIKAQSNFNIHQNISYPLIYYDNILKNITNIQNKIDQENDKKTIQFISLNISFVLNSIKNKLLDSKKFFFNNLHFIFTTLKCSTLSEITKYSGILKTSTNSMDKYENIIKTINTIKAENINIEINIQKTEEIYNMLTIYEDINIKDEQKKKLFLLYPSYLNMLNSAFFNDNLMFTVKQEFYKNTKNKILVFEEKVKSILRMFHSIGPSSENINLNKGMESLKKYINDFKTLEIEKEEIIKAQILCNMKIFLFENFYLLKNTIKIYNSIYSIYNSYTTRINDFLDVIYYKLNIKEINKSLREVKSELQELQKEQPEAKKILAFEKINEELSKMNTTLIIVYLLQNTNMKLTNWQEIISLYLKKNNIRDPITFENNIIINDKNINIKSITLYDMYELKIYLFFNDIKYIIYKIKEVEKLEKRLSKIENTWKQETLKIKKYSDYFILDENKNIFKNIKMTFNDLHLMRNLNFAEDLIPKINNLQNKLLFIYELLSLWMLTQEKWISLERFYNNENFNHFSNELKNFNKINKTYIEIMKNMKKNLNLFHNCNTQFFYFLKNYYDRLTFLSNETISILQDKKFSFPDFFFLSDEQLFDLLSNTETGNLKKYCSIIYEDLSTFNDIDKTIIEIVTTKNNTLNLKNGVKIVGIDTYVILKEKIKSTIKENIITSLKSYYNTNKVIPIITKKVSVVSSLVIKIALSEEIKNVLQHKKIEYTQGVLNKYNALCNNIVEELKKEKGKNVQRIEQSLIIYLEFIDVLRKIIQENLFDENNFFLYYQFIYTLDKNKEKIAIKYGNFSFKYNYDILENSSLFINVLPNNKYIFSICSNIYKSYYNIVCGNNKTSTIRYITSTLGHALIFQNVSEIKVEILSVLTNTFRSIQTCLKKKERNIYIFNKDVTFNSSSVIFFTSKCGRCENIPINLRSLCKETVINNYQQVELVEILLYVNNFPDVRSLCIKLCNLMEYINFIYFSSDKNILSDVLSIMHLCKRGNSELDKEELLAHCVFIYYYDKLKNAKQNKLQHLIKKFLDIELNMKFRLEDGRDRLKELLEGEKIYLKDDLFSKYEKDVYLMKEKLNDQFLSVVFGGPHTGKSTLLKIYGSLYNSKFSFIYLDSLHDSHTSFNEKFLCETIQKKVKKYGEYTFVMKLNYLSPIIYDVLSMDKLFCSENKKIKVNPGNKIKIIIECNDMSYLDPYILNKINKISIRDNINLYNYFKKKSSHLIDNILNMNFFFEKNMENNKTSITYINNYEEKKKTLLELYCELKLFYKNFFLPIFSYIEKKKGNHFDLNKYYTKEDDIKNMNLCDQDLTEKCLFHTNIDEKIIINNFIDIFKSNILIYLRDQETEDHSSFVSGNSISNTIALDPKKIEELDKNKNLEKQTVTGEKCFENYETNEEYDLDNIDKNYIENVCILQAERENNKKVEICSKKEISKISTIKNKSIFILISCLVFLFNNFLNDNEQSNFFSFLKKLTVTNGANVDNCLGNCFYHIQKDKWIPIYDFFNSSEKNHFDEKNLLFHDEETKKRINSISLLYKGESNICLIGNRKNCKTAILNEIVDSHKHIDHLTLNILKYANIVNFKVLHDKLIKKNVKKYFHQSVLYICIDDVHINYEKLNNPTMEFLQNLQRNLCYFEKKTISIENVKSLISLDLVQMKKKNYYEFVSYYYSLFFLNMNRKCLVNYFNALVNHSLNRKFQGIHNKLVNYSLDVFWKIHEDINFEEEKENNLLFTKENIFLLYEDFFFTKTNFEKEEDVIQNWCENAESIILNRILKKENKKDVMKMIKNIEKKYFPNLTNQNDYIYLNYSCKEVYEKTDVDMLKKEFIRSLSSYNNLYVNAKMFVEFYFSKIMEIYKNINKNVNSSMIVCMNKRRAIILLNAIAFMLNINSVIINRCTNLENTQDKINYYNRLRFKKNLFVLINYSSKYDDYFYSLIYKKFPPVLYDKKELFQMYSKTNLISNELKWENIQNIMKNNTYVCLVHERRFDLSTSNLHNYKNIYNDVNVSHLDCWYKEEYIQYCHLFLKNHEDNHFIDNILNNFKKKVILNTLEDDIEKQTKGLPLGKKEKGQQIFINSVDYIKKKKNEHAHEQDEVKESGKEETTEMSREVANDVANDVENGEANEKQGSDGKSDELVNPYEVEQKKEKDPEKLDEDKYQGSSENNGISKPSEETEEAITQINEKVIKKKVKKSMKGENITNGKQQNGHADTKKGGHKIKNIKKEKENYSSNKNEQQTKKENLNYGKKGGNKLIPKSQDKTKKEETGKPPYGGSAKRGIVGKDIKVQKRNAAFPKNSTNVYANKENNKRKEKILTEIIKTGKKEGATGRKLTKGRNISNHGKNIEKSRGKPNKPDKENHENKKQKGKKENVSDVVSGKLKSNDDCHIVDELGDDSRGDHTKVELVTNGKEETGQEVGVDHNGGENVDQNADQNSGEHVDQNADQNSGEHMDQNADKNSGEHVDQNAGQSGSRKGDEYPGEPEAPGEAERSSDKDILGRSEREEGDLVREYNDLKNCNRKEISEINRCNAEVHKYNFFNVIEKQLENVVDVFVEVYYDLKRFLKDKNTNLNFIRINKYNFVDSLIMFYILLKNKLNYKNKQLCMFKMGLKKVQSIFKNYNDMNAEIESIKASIAKKEDSIEKLNDSIKTNSKLLLEFEQQFNSNKQILNKITNDIDEMMENKNESEKQIEEECITIIFKIQNVEQNDIKNILKISNPDITLIYISIMINILVRNSVLNDNNDNWNYFKNFISKENFSKFFFNFKKENVSDKQIKRIKEYMSKDEIIYNSKKIEEMNNLFTFFFEYITFLLKYKEYYKKNCEISDIICNNTLKKEKYENENRKLLEQMLKMKSSIVNNKTEVNIQSELIENLNKKLNLINKCFLPILDIKQFLEKIKKKYHYMIEQIEDNYKYIVSEILLYSFFLNYSSSFSYKYRCFLLDKWKRIIKKNNILIKENIKIETIYSCDSIVSLFISDNFPRHIFYIQNALISLNHFRWPLLLDQQNIGIEWLKKSYSSNLVIHNFDENLSKHLDMCIIYGKSLIIPFFNFQNLYIYDKSNEEGFNCDTPDQDNFKSVRNDILHKKNFLKFKLGNRKIGINSNYNIVEAVIERNVYLINGKYYINIGKKKLEYNSQFRLFLVSDCSDRYFEDIEDYVNIIDFQIDKNLIVNKIINIILKHEDEKKLINFNTKIRNYYETKQTLKFLDDGMIVELCTFNNKMSTISNYNGVGFNSGSGNPCNDNDKGININGSGNASGNASGSGSLMNVINNNVLKKIEIKKMLKEYKYEINKIKNSSENIRCLGYRFHSIYKVLHKHCLIKSVYNFNFNYLLNILSNIIKNINKKMLICNFNQLIKKFTHNCFVFLLNGISKKDRLFFCLLFYTSLLFEEKKLKNGGQSIKIEKEKYYSLFLKMRNLENYDTSCLKRVEWLSGKKKRELLFLQSELENFKLLTEDMENNSIEYFNWYKQKKPEENLFFLKKTQLEKIEKLEIILFLHVMRKDRLYYYLHCLLTNYLDISENGHFNYNFSKELNFIDAKTFVYITEPSNSYDLISAKYSAMKTVSLGNNFNSDIQIVIETSLQNGKKLLLENVHLINFNIEKFYEIYNSKKFHSHFELHLTSEKHASISMIKKAIKIYLHKDEYLKSLLTEFFLYAHSIYKDRLNNNFVNSFLFSLSFFHCILVSRCNYDNFGFDHIYHFDIKDFENTFDCLLFYFNLVRVNNTLGSGPSSTKNKSDHTQDTKPAGDDTPANEVNINWAFVKEIILNGYGNKVSYADRKIVKSYIKEYFNEYSFNEKNEFIYSVDDNYNYKFLLNRPIKEYVNLIKSYPLFNSCKTYGMKIEADKMKQEKYNHRMLKNLEKISSEEILIYKKENNDGDIFFNLDSDYYSSSLLNTDEDEKVMEEQSKSKSGIVQVEISNVCAEEDVDVGTYPETEIDYEGKYLIQIGCKRKEIPPDEMHSCGDMSNMHKLKVNFLKNIKKVNELYELVKKLKLTFKNSIAIKSEWSKGNITTIQACCIEETESSDEEGQFFSNEINYADYVHYDVESYCEVDMLGLHTLNNNFECLGIKPRSNRKYDEVPTVTLSIVEKKEKNILRDKKIALYLYKYNGKLKKNNNKFITNLYFKSDKHKSFIYINKVYIFIYNS